MQTTYCPIADRAVHKKHNNFDTFRHIHLFLLKQFSKLFIHMGMIR